MCTGRGIFSGWGVAVGAGRGARGGGALVAPPLGRLAVAHTAHIEFLLFVLCGCAVCGACVRARALRPRGVTRYFGKPTINTKTTP